MKLNSLIKIISYSVFTLVLLLSTNVYAALSGFITQDTTFTIENSPYSIDGDVFISDGVTVTIDPGVTFQFKANSDLMQSGDYSDKSEIFVYGTLVCEGKSDSVITFKSYFGSNTSGEWGHIKTDLLGKIFIQYANIRYSTNGINIYKSAPMEIRIENCEFQNIESDAIKITSSNINKSYISSNGFESVERAVYSSRSFTYCSFNSITNSTNGIETANNSIITINNLNNLSGCGFKISGNCIVEDNKINGISEIAIFLLGGNCKVINNEIVNINSNGIKLIESSNNSISGNIFKNVDGEGISIIDVHDYYNAGSDNIIKNNLIYQCSNGIKINHLHSTNNFIKYNTITNCSNGIYTDDNANAVYNYCESRNNIIVSNYSYGIYSVPNNGQFNSDYDNVWNNGNNYDPWITPGNNNISVNPFFTNPDLNDFTLQEGSPCLVMGENGGQMGAYGGFRQYNHCPIFEFNNLDATDLFADQSVEIRWAASDPDTDDVFIYLFRDSDRDTSEMTAIDLNLENTGAYTWNTAHVLPGAYYIHAIAYDYKLGRISQYSTAKVIISHDSDNESTPTELLAYPSNRSAALSWQAPQSANIRHYVIYRSTVTGFYPSAADSVGRSTTISYQSTGLTNGTRYYYRVAARKTDGSLSGFSNAISVTPQAVTLQVASASSAPGGEVSIPVAASDLSGLGVIAYQFNIGYNTSFLNLERISTTNCITSAWDAPSVNIGESTVSVWHSGATPLTGVGNLINLEFTVNSAAAPGDSTAIEISEILINEDEPGFNAFNGWYSVYPAFSVRGGARYYKGDHVLEGVTVSLSGAQTASVMTDQTGNYLFSAVPGGWDYEIAASDTGILSQAISAYDPALILRHIAMLESLDEDQLTAADVTGDGTVSSADAANIGQWGVGLITEFQRGEAWYFRPEAMSLTPLESDVEDFDFVGIAYGDVSGNWDCGLAKSVDYPFRLDSSRRIEVEGPDRYIISIEGPWEKIPGYPDSEVYTIVANSTMGILAFTLKFRIEDISKSAIGFVPSHQFSDHMREINYVNDIFIVTSAGVYPAYGEEREIGRIVIDREAAGSDRMPEPIYLEINEHEIDWGTSTSVPGVNHFVPVEFKLYQNYPNPFNNRTVIEFDIPVQGTIRLSIYDLQGKLVRNLVDNRLLNPGKYRIPWDTTDSRGNDVPSGIYFYKFVSADFAESQRLLLIK